jgi:hypothetical protein
VPTTAGQTDQIEEVDVRRDLVDPNSLMLNVFGNNFATDSQVFIDNSAVPIQIISTDGLRQVLSVSIPTPTGSRSSDSIAPLVLTSKKMDIEVRSSRGNSMKFRVSLSVDSQPNRGELK